VPSVARRISSFTRAAMKSVKSRTLGSFSRRCCDRLESCVGRRHRDQPARAQMIGHVEDRFQHDAAPVQRPAGQHVAVIRFEGAGDLEPPRALGGLQRPLELFRTRKAQVQAIVPLGHQRGAVDGHPPPRHIGG